MKAFALGALGFVAAATLWIGAEAYLLTRKED